MSRFTDRIFALLLFLGSPAAAHSQVPIRPESASVVITSGLGEVTVAPDRAVLRLGVATRAQTAAQATNANAARVRLVLDSLNAFRQPDESVLVVGVTVRPYHDNQRNELRGYDAVTVVRVATRTLDRLSRILDIALAAGATSFESITWTSDREQTARRDALSRAFAEAQANAQALASAAGLELGPLLRVSTEPQFGPFAGGANLSAVTVTGLTVTGYGGVPITPSDIVVRASVQLTWRLLARAR